MPKDLTTETTHLPWRAVPGKSTEKKPLKISVREASVISVVSGFLPDTARQGVTRLAMTEVINLQTLTPSQ
jgi:hypothetical protein